MFNLQAILVPTDFSEASKEAITYATDLSKLMNGTIHLVHVVEPVVYPTELLGYTSYDTLNLENSVAETSERMLKKMSEEIVARGSKCEIAVLRGRASDEIVQFAKDHTIGMICISASGQSGIEHMLFGSTTERVLRKSPCPVLAIRKHEL